MSGFKLKSSIKKRWVEALRSRKYKKGESALRIIEDGKERFCCLGVLADVCDMKWSRPGPGFYAYRINRKSGYLPKAILPKKIQIALASLNDGGVSFRRIAIWIEKNL